MTKAIYSDERVRENLLKKRIMHSGDCWEWNGATLTSGYGTCKYRGQQVLVHRLSAFLFKNIPLETEVIMHSCDNRACFNPDHLEGGTQQENMIDMKSKGRVVSAIGESPQYGD